MIWFNKKKKLVILSDLQGRPATFLTEKKHKEIVESVLGKSKNISTNGVDIQIKYI